MKWKELVYPNLRHVLHNLNCGIAKGIDKQINATEQKMQK